MDHRSAKDEDAEIDLECGVAISDDFQKSDDNKHRVSCNDSNLSGASMDFSEVTNKSSVHCAAKTPTSKEKHKKSCNKKSPKPPRPPRAPSLDAADQKLIREISELAMLKRARIERMKALKKMKAAKTSSASGSSMFAMIFTVIFCIVIVLQGMSPGKTSVASFQGSPEPAGEAEAALIEVQLQPHLNPSSSDVTAPSFESHSHNFVQRITGSDFPVKLSRDAH
ncbi:hypothetical protein HN51_063897 [Arachis hypogaea]|uniref:Transmembrane protein n=1 Tax=Arachis hypogaea TaxID=3818 RepID=A0A445AWG9_ARAHY|nr:uncharacterized protein LOC107639352 [Arachis ipaensis]XP_025630239.1 uncharacterized protein LOC112723191 [Arachis hypogaea]QHO21498.1 uncharacterized protein DS421_11g347250 [Arachis hypogaea]RYR30733.1 hypothetical protein Ahy_B01g055502 isoform A [Arachis hypogaea]RYR30734.1 hypothetical protein Ahy_B01g055502 isoform B [Arachis hypogaea]